MPPPPPVTPSPHRFVVKKEAAAARRTPLTQTQTHHQADHTRHSSTQQFNVTPRFTFSSTPRLEATQRLPGPPSSAARFSTPRPTAADKPAQDAIQSSASDLPEDVQDSIELDDGDIDVRSNSAEEGKRGEEDDEYMLEERTPKRRRVSTPMILDTEDYVLEKASNRSPVPQSERHGEDDYMTYSSPPPILSSPTATVLKRASKFILSTPLPPSTPHTAQLPHQQRSPAQIPTQPFSRPPRFRPPDPPDPASNSFDPLPEQFSPHRKGQKYVPGGLAAEVRNWLVNLESSIPVAAVAVQGSKKSRRASWGGDDEEWVLRIIVDEVSGGSGAGMVIIQGRQIDGSVDGNVHDSRGDGDEMILDSLKKVRIILAGEGQGVGIRKGEKVEVGKILGVKGPAWEVGIDGGRWGVAVEWKVLR